MEEGGLLDVVFYTSRLVHTRPVRSVKWEVVPLHENALRCSEISLLLVQVIILFLRPTPLEDNQLQQLPPRNAVGTRSPEA